MTTFGISALLRLFSRFVAWPDLFCRFFHASKSWNERRGSWTSLAFGAFRDFAADLLIFLLLCN